MFKQGL